MTDHFARPRRAASSERVAELHELAREDYARGKAERATPNLSPSYAAASHAAAVLAVEPSDLDVAISVAQQLLDSDQVLSLREGLRLLLRALDAEPENASLPGKTSVSQTDDEQEAARRSVDRAFPVVAAFLANERGERR